jgi:hypothetical protein
MSTAADDLRLDNLITSTSLLMAGIAEDKARRARLDARLERIERALAIPAVYWRKEACSRLGISTSTGARHPERLPKPVARGKYSVSDIEALVEAPQLGERPRRGRERIVS